jgi:putative membrane protein
MQKSTGLMAVAAVVALAGAACRADSNDAQIGQNTTREEAEAERAAATPAADLAAAAARKGAVPASGREAPARGGLNQADRDFAQEAASGGMMEVELGKVAAARAQAAEVKAFGQQMADDHSKANARLKQVAANKGISMPAQMTPEHKAKLDQLSALSGEEFDRKYMDAMVKDHEEDVTKFEHALREGQDEDLKQFVKETLPTLRTHLAEAQRIDKNQDASASAQGAEGDANRDKDQ